MLQLEVWASHVRTRVPVTNTHTHVPLPNHLLLHQPNPWLLQLTNHYPTLGLATSHIYILTQPSVIGSTKPTVAPATPILATSHPNAGMQVMTSLKLWVVQVIILNYRLDNILIVTKAMRSLFQLLVLPRIYACIVS